ncbi:hypothetical protein [Streptomyces sp. S186]|uniref:hypothetical protein n=1 Tax=Streptomyces sp. S186 TaxID=3434395 RepID=UPI003F680A7A
MDTQIASGAPEMDKLQRVGAGALLEQGVDSVESIDGPDGVEVEIADTWVGVHPGGVSVKVFVDAPALKFAEEAVHALVEELLERSELLADWTVERCEVELHPDLAKESLEAADGPDTPPDQILRPCLCRRGSLFGMHGNCWSAGKRSRVADRLLLRQWRGAGVPESGTPAPRFSRRLCVGLRAVRGAARPGAVAGVPRR